MPSIRIWTLESDNDAKAVKCLANKLKEYLKLEAMSIDTTGRLKPPMRLKDAIRNLLEDDDYVILIISFKRLTDRYQKGNTENIVEAEQGGRGAKEYLTEFSERVLRELNPNLTQRNIDREKYQEKRSPEVAEHIEINKETLRRNNSLKKLGDVIAQFQ